MKKLQHIWKLLYLLVLVALLGMGTLTVSAQGLIQYGQPILAESTEQVPFSFFMFNGAAGDRVHVEVTSVQPGMDLSVSLLSPRQEQMGFNDNVPQSGNSDPELYASLTETGIYTVLVGNVNGVFGQYVLSVQGEPLSFLAPLIPNQEQVVVFGPGGVLLEYSIQLLPECLSYISIYSDVAASAVVRDENYRPIVYSMFLPGEVDVELPSGTQQYSVYLEPIIPDEPGTGYLYLTQDCSAGQPNPPTSVAPTQQYVDPNGPCTVIPGGNANLRSGPGTDYAIAGTLYAGQSANPVGYATGTDGYIWYQLPNGYWVRSDVVNRQGNCSGLSQVTYQPPGATYTPSGSETPSATPTPSATSNYTATPSYTPGGPTLTPTYTPTATQATATYTPSYTPTATVPVSTAPPDANYAMQIALDSTASLTDFVSFPEGDTEDVVSYSTTGLNPNVSLSGGQAQLVFTFSCFGTGTQHITFVVDGQSRTCGQSYTRNVTFDSHTGAVRITAVGGTNTYVQWVVTATLTRTN